MIDLLFVCRVFQCRAVRTRKADNADKGIYAPMSARHQPPQAQYYNGRSRQYLQRQFLRRFQGSHGVTFQMLFPSDLEHTR
ncbi:hypothetical protein BN2364_1061 [Alloalcanivorax xenomutans]|nr:hypothetical protein BN2364_1061 [Alloalcanivorax xenomutans]